MRVRGPDGWCGLVLPGPTSRLFHLELRDLGQITQLLKKIGITAKLAHWLTEALKVSYLCLLIVFRGGVVYLSILNFIVLDLICLFKLFKLFLTLSSASKLLTNCSFLYSY